MKFKSGSVFSVYEKKLRGKKLAGPFSTKEEAETFTKTVKTSTNIIETPKDPFEGIV